MIIISIPDFIERIEINRTGQLIQGDLYLPLGAGETSVAKVQYLYTPSTPCGA
jgi:hypothetical protein